MKVGNNALSAAIKAALMAAPGLAVTPSGAQQAQQGQPTGQLEEISVYGKPIRYLPDSQTTATGLNMQLIDTPQSISVITDDMLTEANARTLYEAADLVAGLSQGGQGNGVTHMLLRGQYVTETRVDGLNFGTVTSLQLVDNYALERVEIVRGPATALYGITGAFGGEINQILKKPQKDFRVEAGFEFGDFAERRYRADVTGAIPDTDGRLKIRVVGAYTDYGIFQNIVIPPKNINKLLTAAVTFDVTPATTLSLTTYKEDRNFDATDGCPLAKNQATGQLYFPFQIPVEKYYCGDPKQNRVSTTDEYTIASLAHKFDNGWYANANVGYAKASGRLNYVYGFGPAGAFGLPADDIYLYSYARNIDDTTLTVNMSLGGTFELFEQTQQFFAAMEYQKERDDTVVYQSSGLGLMNMFQDGGKGILANGNPIVVPTPSFSDDQLAEFKELRGSVQLLLSPATRWNVLVGLLAQRTNLTDSSVFTNNRPSTYGSFSETDFLKRFGVTYGLLSEKKKWLSAAKTYFSYSEGFQPNVGVFGANGQPLTAPQRMKSYEVGLKTQWLNSRVNANVALYDSTRTNIPTQIITSVGGSGGMFANVLEGKNTYKGVEFELLGEVLRGWNASFTYAFTNYTQESFLFPQSLAVHDVPKHTAALMNSYEFLSGSLKGLILGATVIRRIDSPLADNPVTLYQEHYNPSNQVFESCTIFNFRASYKGFSGGLKGFEVYANVNNAFNARFEYSNQGNPGFSATIMAPRALSGGINYRF